MKASSYLKEISCKKEITYKKTPNENSFAYIQRG